MAWNPWDTILRWFPLGAHRSLMDYVCFVLSHTLIPVYFCPSFGFHVPDTEQMSWAAWRSHWDVQKRRTHDAPARTPQKGADFISSCGRKCFSLKMLSIFIEPRNKKWSLFSPQVKKSLLTRLHVLFKLGEVYWFQRQDGKSEWNSKHSLHRVREWWRLGLIRPQQMTFHELRAKTVIRTSRVALLRVSCSQSCNYRIRYTSNAWASFWSSLQLSNYWQNI